MSTKNIYNNLTKILYAETHLIGAFTCNAKRYQKSQNFLRRNASYPLWWNVPNSVVLQKARLKVATAKLCAISPAQQPLHNRRITYSPSVYHNRWTGKTKLYTDTPIQWFIPSHSWLKEFSQCNYLEAFSLKTYSSSTATDTFSSRPFTSKNILLSKPTHQYNIGPRYHHSDCLWQVGGGSQRIQSPQAWSVIVSSIALFRSPHPRLLTREVLSWWRVYRLREEKVHRRSLGQVTSPYLQDKNPWRLQMVRPQNSASSRRTKDRLCHRSQTQPTHPAPSGRVTLSRIQKRLGGSRIQISTSPIYLSPLHRSTQIPLRRKYCSAYTVYAKRLRLPCDSYKLRTSSRECLEILLRPSQDRVKYQRAKGGLLSFQDTHKKLFSKQGVFPSSFIRLQYSQLVQKIMSSASIPVRYITDYSQRIFSFTSTISENWTQKLIKTSSSLCLQLGI